MKDILEVMRERGRDRPINDNDCEVILGDIGCRLAAEEIERLRDALAQLHSAVDDAMGDSDLLHDDSDLLIAMQNAASVLPVPR